MASTGDPSGRPSEGQRARARVLPTGILEVQGFRVLRFTNREVLGEMDVVLDTILHACAARDSHP